MGFADIFKFGSSGVSTEEIPNLFPLSVTDLEFIKIDVASIYSKILTDVAERSQGLSDDEQVLLWDNCLASESSDGLITLLSRAMYDKAELFLVYDKAVGVIRKATDAEATQIKADYKRQAESKVGTFVSFKNYKRTDMLKVYSALEYCTVNALNKSMNLARAVQIKISDLRASVSLADSSEAKAQAVNIAKALKDGKDVLLDSKDILDLLKPDLTSAKSSMELINEKRSFYLNLPSSYITGVLNSGLGDTGQADAKAIDRGLKGYFVSIMKPVCKSLFGKDLDFKSDDFQQLSTNLEVLKTFELTSEEFMSAENKLRIVNKIFGFPENEKGGPKEEPPATPPDPTAGARDVTPPPQNRTPAER